jgi:hypothetical protein
MTAYIDVFPAQAGIQVYALDSRLRGNDGNCASVVDATTRATEFLTGIIDRATQSICKSLN